MCDQSLVQGYSITVEGLPCQPGGDDYAATVQLQGDITPALPYLNRILDGANYHPSAASLVWRHQGHAVAFWPDKIAIADIEDHAEADALARALVALINDAWGRRESIEPDHEPRRRVAPLTLYNLLPRTNCRQCGEPTCYTFALKLAASQRQLGDCPPMQTEAYATQRAAIARRLPS